MGSKPDTTQTSEASPWAGQQSYLSDLFGQAQGIYQGGGPQYYPGQTVAPFSPQTQMGMNMTMDRAMGGSPQEAAFGNYLTNQLSQQNINPSAVFNPAQQAAGGIGQGMGMMSAAGQPMNYAQALQMAGMGSPFAGGAPGAGGVGEAPQGAGGLPAILDPAMQMGAGVVDPAATGQLAATAGGDYLGANPYLDQMFGNAADQITERFQEQVMPGLNAQFGAAGRTGSGTQALMAGRAAGDVAGELRGLAGDIYAPAYEAERGRQQQAAGALGQLGLGGGQLGAGLYSTSLQNALGQRGLAANLFTGGQNRQLQAGSQLGSLGMQGVGAMGNLYGNIAQNQFRAGSLVPSMSALQYGNIDRMMGMGGMLEDQSQRLINANMDRWNFGQNAPWQNLGQYSNIVNQMPGGYGATTQTTPGGSRLSGALGGAMAGASLGPWGAAGGALLGGIL